jgi:hypothetical protein
VCFNLLFLPKENAGHEVTMVSVISLLTFEKLTDFPLRS